jgi:DNA segregation ATPase FtsK/SpoIIIE, S-DNA-T family
VPEPSLPAVPATAVEPLVLDGEVVDEAAATAAGAAAARLDGPGRSRTASAILRHLGYIAAGLVVAWRRHRHRRTRHERTLRALEAQGNHEAMLAWQQHAELARKQRHDRRRAVVELVPAVVRGGLLIAAAAAVLPGVLGLALAFAHHDLPEVIAPYYEAARLVALAAEVASVALSVAAFAVPAAAVAGLWQLGRTGGGLAPSWAVAAKAEDQDRGLVVTADTVVLGLRHTPITPLKNALKDGWVPVFSLPPVREGRGYQYAHSLPLGVTAEMIADQRPVLARNLHREPNEVWPVAGAPGEVSVYVLDRGAMERAAPEYPLLHEGQADVFEGVPGGVVGRGDMALIPVTGNNGVLGGLMGQGKSNGARVFMLGCATDPLPRLGVFTFANNGDFDAYAPRLEVYRKGLDDDVVEAAVAHLEEMYEDVGRVEGILAELGAKKVTRQLAMKYPELRPRVSLFSECHELFGHPEHGERAGELAVKTIKRARKTARVLWFDTQSSRKSAIPPALVELVSVNCCFAVKSWRSNDGFLGDGSFAAGIRATELRPGRDRGTSLVTGISDAQFELLKWYFVEVNDDTGYDAAAGVIARAMRNLAPGTPVGATLPLPAIEARDLLADLAEVTRDDGEPVRLSVLAVRLKDLARTWGPYKSLTGTELRGQLEREGVRTTNTSNVPRLDPADLRSALARREVS